jgi:hypothetical protein
MECIFGLDWKVDQIRPWILDTIEFFRPERCMFASHMPIAKLARSFQDLYCAYLDVVSEFSTSGSGSSLRCGCCLIFWLFGKSHHRIRLIPFAGQSLW